MKRKTFAVACLLTAPLFTAPLAAFAADAAKGEADFKACRACHAITGADGTVIQKGGKTGPNLFGIVGRPVASAEGFSYSDGLKEVGASGTIWDAELLAGFLIDPNAWVKEKTGNAGAKSKMTFKAKGDPADLVAYLASVGGGSADAAPAAGGATSGTAAPADKPAN